MRNKRNLKIPFFLPRLNFIPLSIFLPPLSDCTRAKGMGPAHIVTLGDGAVQVSLPNQHILWFITYHLCCSFFLTLFPCSSLGSIHMRQISRIFNMDPFHRLHFFTEFFGVRPFHKVQPFRKRLLQFESRTKGSQVRPGSLLQHELLSPQGLNLLKTQLTLLSARAHCCLIFNLLED